MMVAMGTSLWIGVKNFHHPQTSSACVMFQELCLQLAYIFQDDGCLGYILVDRSEEFPPPPDIISLRRVSGALFTVSLYFRMMVALGTSLWIGVKNFHHPQTSSACVVFQELCLQLAYISG